ncbi:tyrosine-type recombinase/integrase [Salinicola lusitanus]|uniref:tyrosine-type recombinase/integrase n=1 Tax=Salinicola lusitanus TaxID=1949085 RepID=UPI000DA1BD90|nr:site-specific integrase [Salinicola lusitanus]
MPYKRPGSPYWWVSITPPAGGKPIRRSTRTVDKREADALEGQWRAQLFRQSAWGEEPEHPFEEVAAEFLLASANKRSLPDIKLRVGKLYDHFGGFSMNGLCGKDVRGFIDWRRGHGVTDSTINRELSILAAMINHAIVHLEWKLPNPVRGRMLREPEGRVRWITRAEAARLMQKAVEMREGDRLRDFIELSLNTGCRKNELLKLEWRRVDFNHNLITLESEDNKSAKRRTVPLNDVAVRCLKRRASWIARHCPGTPWVFSKRDGSRYMNPRNIFQAACRAVPIRDFRIHDLRHTAASWMVSEGVPLADVKDVLGHSTITMTEKYAHLAPHRARDAVAKLQSQSSHTERPVHAIESLIGRKKRAI